MERKMFLRLLALTCLAIAESRPPSPADQTTIGNLLVKDNPIGSNALDVMDEKASLRSKMDEKASNVEPDIIVTEMLVNSEIRFRYSKTVVETYVKNPSSVSSSSFRFKFLIPNEAFVSNFSMLIGEKEFVAEVEERSEAADKYEEAVSRGSNAGIVTREKGLRDSSLFAVETSVVPKGKVRFFLTYEEALERRNGFYEQFISIDNEKRVEDLRIRVSINESLPIVGLFVPELTADETALKAANPDAAIEYGESKNEAVVTYVRPEMTKGVRGGLKGRFAIKYDVDRKGRVDEVQALDGYFVHFIAPEKNLEPLPKHVVFLLDVSGSMGGLKLEQLKDAMVTIIDDLTPRDRFNLLTFSDEVYNWSKDEDKDEQLSYSGSLECKREALDYVLSLEAIAGTNINDGLLKALDMIEMVQAADNLDPTVVPMIVFLTDGQATSGSTTESSKIVANVARANERKASIFGLAFGEGADFDLIKSVSADNRGFARRIYSGADAALQLESFYGEISNPLLSNLTVTYVGEAVEDITEPKVATYFEGGELAVSGKLRGDDNPLSVKIEGLGSNGTFSRIFTICPRVNNEDQIPFMLPIDCIPIQRPKSDAQNFIERLWAYKTIRASLKAGEDKDNNNNRTLELALRYNFVTHLTSLVVLGENDTKRVSDPVAIPFGSAPPAIAHRSFFFSAPIPMMANRLILRKSSAVGRSNANNHAMRPSSFSLNDYDYDHIEEEPSVETATPKNSSSCHGNITLYDRTYLRGNNLTFINDQVVDDGLLEDFMLTSLKVSGTCCWRIFREKSSEGKSEFFRYDDGRNGDGEFVSAGQMGSVFRKALSLETAPCP